MDKREYTFIAFLAICIIVYMCSVPLRSSGSIESVKTYREPFPASYSRQTTEVGAKMTGSYPTSADIKQIASEIKPIDDNNKITSHEVKLTDQVSLRQCDYSERGNYLRTQCKARNDKDTMSLLDLIQQHRDKWNDSTLVLPDVIKKALPSNLFVDTKHSLLVCLVPKTGVTSYTAMLIQYSNHFMNHYHNKNAFDVYGYKIYYVKTRNEIMAARKISPIQLIDALQNNYKIVTTRHPFTRLYSFYKDKVAGSDCKKLIGFPDKIVEYTRGIKVAERRDACGMNITFEEFISYYRSHRQHDGNEHLLRIHKMCLPCKIPYDTFLRTETASVDQEYIVNSYLASTNNTTSSITSFKTNVKTALSDSGFTQQLQSFRKLTNDDIKWLQSFYADDLTLFGYNVDKRDTDLVANCDIKTQSGNCC